MYSYSKKIVRSLASGDTLSISIYTFKGKKKNAPSAYLQSAMHGSEVQGSLVIAKLIEHFKKNPPLGDIRLVPNVNPMGLNQKCGEYTDGRHDPSTGENWNRMYTLPSLALNWDLFLREEPREKTWERFRIELKKKLLAKIEEDNYFSRKLSLTLQLLSIDFDHCIDLHCANNSVRHLYTPHFASKDADFFHIPYHLVMENGFDGAMDEVFFSPWWTLQEKIGGPVPVQSFTLELGDHEKIDSRSADEDVKGILTYLAHRGVIKGKAKRANAIKCNLSDYKIVFAPVGGLVDFKATLGKVMEKGSVLAHIYQFGAKNKKKEILSPIRGIPILQHSSSIVHEGAELIKLMKV